MQPCCRCKLAAKPRTLPRLAYASHGAESVAMRSLILFCLGCVALAASETPALSIVERSVTWTHDGREHRGFLAKPEIQVMAIGVAPGMLVLPEWWGINDFSREQARRLARQGYSTLTVDIYGGGAGSDDPAKAKELATPFYQDRGRFVAAVDAGREALVRHANVVNPERIGAIGFCFGGTAALEAARAGAPLAAAISVHGGLASPTYVAPGSIRAPILVLHGGADSFVKPSEVADFITAMESARADYRLHVLGGALHAYTNPGAERYRATLGVGHHRQATVESFALADAFLRDHLSRR
jgi:dienelactone hydrolase